MTTAQDQQSRAEFDLWWKEHGLGSYDTQLEAWQAARALPAGDDALLPIAAKSHGAWDGLEELLALPDGTEVYTAAQVQAMLMKAAADALEPYKGNPVSDEAKLRAAAIYALGWLEDYGGNMAHDVVANLERALAAAPRPPAAQDPILSNSADLERKLLTDEQIDAALIAWFGRDTCLDAGYQYRMRAAINAAHGITHPTGD